MAKHPYVHAAPHRPLPREPFVRRLKRRRLEQRSQPVYSTLSHATNPWQTADALQLDRGSHITQRSRKPVCFTVAQIGEFCNEADFLGVYPKKVTCGRNGPETGLRRRSQGKQTPTAVGCGPPPRRSWPRSDTAVSVVCQATAVAGRVSQFWGTPTSSGRAIAFSAFHRMNIGQEHAWIRQMRPQPFLRAIDPLRTYRRDPPLIFIRCRTPHAIALSSGAP